MTRNEKPNILLIFKARQGLPSVPSSKVGLQPIKLRIKSIKVPKWVKNCFCGEAPGSRNNLWNWLWKPITIYNWFFSQELKEIKFRSQLSLYRVSYGIRISEVVRIWPQNGLKQDIRNLIGWSLTRKHKAISLYFKVISGSKIKINWRNHFRNRLRKAAHLIPSHTRTGANFQKKLLVANFLLSLRKWHKLLQVKQFALLSTTAI